MKNCKETQLSKLISLIHINLNRTWLVENIYAVGKCEIVHLSEAIMEQLQKYPNIQLAPSYLAYSRVEYFNSHIYCKDFSKSTKRNSCTIR